VEPYRVPDASGRINARWTNEELLLAVQGIRKFGKNFGAIASILGTKTEAHVRSFFVNYKRRYNLDAALKEHEVEFGPSDQDGDDNLKDGEDSVMETEPIVSSTKSRPSSPRSQPRSPATNGTSKVNGSSK